MFFFFQAEDGIRDLTVTGVQTCALPISVSTRVSIILAALDRVPEHQPFSASTTECQQCPISILFLSGIVTEIELAQIAVQVLLSYMVIHAVDTTLQGCKIALNPVRGNDHAIFMGGLAHPASRIEPSLLSNQGSRPGFGR